MATMNIRDFCDKRGIQWIPMDLDFSGKNADGTPKKEPMEHPMYRGHGKGSKPDMNFFKTKSEALLNSFKQSYDEFEYIGMDTSHIMHVDVDWKDDVTYDGDGAYWVNELQKMTPYFKSVTKKQGKHLLVECKAKFKCNRPKTKCKDIELLKGQWSYVKKDALVYNADMDYHEVDDDEIDEFIGDGLKPDEDSGVEEDYPLLKKVESKNQEGGVGFPHLESVLYLIPPENYDVWTRCVWALKNEGEQYRDLARRWSQQSAKYEEDVFDKLWENGRKGNTIGTIFFLAHKIKPKRYREIYIKHDLSVNDDALADTFIKLQNGNVLYSNETVYLYQNNWVAEKPKNCLMLKKLIRTTLSSYILKVEIDHNRNMIGKDESELREMKATKDLIKKVFDKVNSRAQIDNITAFVLQDLASENLNIQFDLCEEQLYNLHFANGVYELDNKQFRKRTKDDYITMFLDWDYKPADEEKVAELREFYRRIQPDRAQLKYMLEWLAYCLCGSVGKQKFKMNIGYSAQNGKSTEFKIHNAVFPIYSMKLDNQTFDKGYSKRHKQIIHLIQRPIRFAYCEELRSSKLDTDFVKEFVDGSDINVEVMYDTSRTQTIQAKLNTCSNKDFNLDKDCGIQRRGTVQFYTSKFVKNVVDDEKKHIYCRKDEYEKRFQDPEYKNAYLQLLLEYYDIDFETPVANENAFADIMNEYDECGTILAEHFEITGDDNDRISKVEMLNLFNQYKSGSKNWDWRSLLVDLKGAGIVYSKNRRAPGSGLGCFVGISKKLDDDEEECDDI